MRERLREFFREGRVGALSLPTSKSVSSFYGKDSKS